MPTLPLDRALARRALKPIAGRAHGGASAMLLLDTVAAIGFAAGLAGGVDAIARGASPLGWAALMVASGLVRGASTLAAARFGARRAREAKRSLRGRIVAAALQRMPGGARTTGGWIAAAVDEVEAIDGHVARYLPTRIASGFAPLLVLAAVAVASPFSAIILIGTLIPFIAAMALAGGAAADQSRRQFAALARLSDIFADRLRALPVILAFGAGEREAERVGEAARHVASRTLKVLRVAFLSSAALEFFAALSVALVAVYAGFNLLGLFPLPVPEQLDLPHALFVLALAPEFYAPLRRLAAAYHDRQAAETAANRLQPVLQAPPRSVRPARSANIARLELRGLTVQYPESDAPAVEGFDLTIARGETVALVGPSGSGKSSILHALIGLAPVVEGDIRIDGVPLAVGEDLSPSAAWVGQSTLIVPGTIGSNIAIGRRDAPTADIIEAAMRVGLQPVLARRGGLDGPVDPRGSGLSGGERRRIGLARALLCDTPLLLLDEPTAHLDAEAETALIDAIRTAGADRIVLLATHSDRLAAIADRVVRIGGRN